MEKHKVLTCIVIGLLIAVSVALCVFVFFVEPPFAWLTSALFVVESLLYMGLSMLRKSEHYKIEFYSSLAACICFAITMILEII